MITINPMKRCAVSVLVAGVVNLTGAAGTQPEIIFISPTNHLMPLAQFQNGEIQGGLIKDIGEAIAKRLGRKARFISLPSMRVARFLSAGTADSVCYVKREWISGTYYWSRPFIPNAGVVAARTDAPHISALEDLADQPVGTVLGYNYPELQHALNSHFVREDAPSMELNLRKLLAGRMKYAIVEQNALAYRMRTDKGIKLRADLVFAKFKASCAFSRKSSIPFVQADQAINSLVEDGSIDRILSRYQ